MFDPHSLLIAPEGIEIYILFKKYEPKERLLIAPEGIEIYLIQPVHGTQAHS